MSGPSPHGEGGLKFKCPPDATCPSKSLPTRGGWIEIILSVDIEQQLSVPPHTGRVD